MDYKNLKAEEVKALDDEKAKKALEENDLAYKEVKEELDTKKAELESLKTENEELKKNQKEEEPPKTAEELIKELF